MDRADGLLRTPLAKRVDRWLAPSTLAPDQLGDVPSQHGFRASDKGLSPMSLDDYLRLLDWVGRQERRDKRGMIPSELAPMLDRLGVAGEEVVETVRDFPRRFLWLSDREPSRRTRGLRLRSGLPIA